MSTFIQPDRPAAAEPNRLIARSAGHRPYVDHVAAALGLIDAALGEDTEDDDVARFASDVARANRNECERVERRHAEGGDFPAWVGHLAS